MGNTGIQQIEGPGKHRFSPPGFESKLNPVRKTHSMPQFVLVMLKMQQSQEKIELRSYNESLRDANAAKNTIL